MVSVHHIDGLGNNGLLAYADRFKISCRHLWLINYNDRSIPNHQLEVPRTFKLTTHGSHGSLNKKLYRTFKECHMASFLAMWNSPCVPTTVLMESLTILWWSHVSVSNNSSDDKMSKAWEEYGHTNKNILSMYMYLKRHFSKSLIWLLGSHIWSLLYPTRMIIWPKITLGKLGSLFKYCSKSFV